jgi:transposase-like protein
MDREARTFRRDAARHIGDRTGTAIRYTPDLRRRAAGIARRRQRSGVGVAAVARELGLRPRALRLWLQEPRSRPRLRPVAVTTAAETAAPSTGLSVLVTEHGVRVDGLDLGTLVALLRGLR